MFQNVSEQLKHPKGFWGKITAAVMRKLNTSLYEWVVEELDIQENDSVFEIGYGHGLGVEKTLQKTTCTIEGIDFSKVMHTIASKRNRQAISEKKATLHLGNFLDFKIKQNYYDKLLCVNVIYFWDDLEAPFAKIKNSLKEGGLFCLYIDSKEDLEKFKFTKSDLFNKYSVEFLTKKLKLAGFNKVEVEFKEGYLLKCW